MIEGPSSWISPRLALCGVNIGKKLLPSVFCCRSQDDSFGSVCARLQRAWKLSGRVTATCLGSPRVSIQTSSSFSSSSLLKKKKNLTLDFLTSEVVPQLIQVKHFDSQIRGSPMNYFFSKFSSKIAGATML